jgi:hypothetical protein
VPGHLDETQRDDEEARTLYELLQDQVIPTYYRTGPMGYSPEWVAMSKRSIATISPRFNVIRMVSEYVKKFYAPAARTVAAITARIFNRASGRRLENSGPCRLAGRSPASSRHAGTPSEVWRLLHLEVAVQLNGLTRKMSPSKPCLAAPGTTAMSAACATIRSPVRPHRITARPLHAGIDAGAMRQAGISHPHFPDTRLAHPPA